MTDGFTLETAPSRGRSNGVQVADLVTPLIKSIHPYEPGRPIEEVERELGLSGVVKLASNENPLGPSPLAMAALHDAIGQAHLYPDGACFHLRRRIARHLGLADDEIAPGNGSNEVIDLLVRTFTVPGDELIAPAQTFVCYQLAAQTHNLRFVEAPRHADLGYDVDAILAAVTPRTRFVFLANPDNPTGVFLGAAEMTRLVRELPPHIVLVIDAAYDEYVRTDDRVDLLAARRDRRLLVILRTFSKLYGLAGTRCGYGIVPPEMTPFLNRVRNPFNVSALAQVAGAAALDDTAHVARTLELNRAGMEQVAEGLARLGVAVTPSQANFLFFDVAPRGGREVFDALLRRGVIVRPLGGYRFPHAIRVTIGTTEENDRFLRALAEVLA